LRKKTNFNIAIIAGYDVLAQKIPDHVEYVSDSVARSMLLDADMVIFVGGATNPDYPTETEAVANCSALEKNPMNKLEIWDIGNDLDPVALMEIAANINIERAENYAELLILPVKLLPIGNTSAETLIAAKEFIEENKIPVGKLILCAEKARASGFSYDALEVGLSDLAQEIYVYGHPFPDSQKEFERQRRKMLGKVLSHRSVFFRKLREFKQKTHQYKVARDKRQQK